MWKPGANSTEALSNGQKMAHRPLLHMNLQRLEAAGLVEGQLELSDDGKAMKYFTVTPFALELTPEAIAKAVESLSAPDAARESWRNRS